MAWETRARGGRYYTRSIRRHGRVHREYVGTGPAAELIAQLDADDRADRHRDRRDVAQHRAASEAVEAAVDDLDAFVEMVVRLELVCAGFHRHHRGDWRKRRD